jgi:hypothetical protein
MSARRVPDAAISDFISEIEQEIRAPSPSEFQFSESVQQAMVAILSNSGSPATLNSPEFRFADGFSLVLDACCLRYPIVGKFPSLFAASRLLPICEWSSWLILFNLVPQCQKLFEDQGVSVFDSLAVAFTDFRQALLETTTRSNLSVIVSQLSSASLVTFLAHSFHRDEIRFDWVFLARVEGDARNLLLGFCSPEINAYHNGVFQLLPEPIQKFIPRYLGAFLHNRDKINPKDMLTSFGRQRRYTHAWHERRNCLFTTNAHTKLVARGLELRGSPLVKSPRRHIVSKGLAERSSMTIVRTAAVLDHANQIVAEHRTAIGARLQTIYSTETACIDTLRKNKALARPIGFSFGTFANARTRRALPQLIDEEFRGLSPSQITAKHCEKIHAVAAEIAARHSELWGRRGTADNTTIEVLQEYFHPTLDLGVT